MYIGDPSESGVEHLIYELVANSIDQFLLRQATHISVQIDESGIEVSDDGPGLPYEIMHADGSRLAESYFLSFHDTPTADGHAPHVHLSHAGFGLIAVNALSQETRVISHRAGLRWEQVFQRGKAISPVISTPSDATGTSIRFKPDPEVMTANVPRHYALRRKLFDTVHLHPGLTIELGRERFHSSRGLADLAAFGTAPRMGTTTQTFEAVVELSGITINAAAAGEAGRTTTAWRSWANGNETPEGGTHVQGFQDALRRCQWQPAAAMIHVLLTKPQFASPTRSRLGTQHVRKQVRDALSPLVIKFTDSTSS